MGFDSGATTVTGNVTTTISGNLPSPSGTQTIIHKTLNAHSTGATIHTVTAGKTFYVLGTSHGGSAASVGNFVVSATNYCTSLTVAGACCVMSGGVLFTVPASTAITVTHNAGASNGYSSIWGYEV